MELIIVWLIQVFEILTFPEAREEGAGGEREAWEKRIPLVERHEGIPRDGIQSALTVPWCGYWVLP